MCWWCVNGEAKSAKVGSLQENLADAAFERCAGGDDCQNRGLWTSTSLPAALAWTAAAAEEHRRMGRSLRVSSPAKACIVSSRRTLGRPTVASLGRQALQPTTTCHASTPQAPSFVFASLHPTFSGARIARPTSLAVRAMLSDLAGDIWNRMLGAGCPDVGLCGFLLKL